MLIRSHAFDVICGILEAILIPLLFRVRVTSSGMGGSSKIGRRPGSRCPTGIVPKRERE